MELDAEITTASYRSSLLQLLQGTLGKELDFQAQETILKRRLMLDSNFRYRPNVGLQIGVKQDRGRLWFARAPTHELECLTLPEKVSNPEAADRNGNLRVEQTSYPWWVAQCLHYGLSFPSTHADAESRIRTALLASTLKTPPGLQVLTRRLEKAYQTRQRTQQHQQRGGVLGQDITVEENNGHCVTDAHDEERLGHSREQRDCENSANLVVHIPGSSVANEGRRASTEALHAHENEARDAVTSMVSVSPIDDSDFQGREELRERTDIDYVDCQASSDYETDSDVATNPDVKITRSAAAETRTRKKSVNQPEAQATRRTLGRGELNSSEFSASAITSHRLSTQERTIGRPKVQQLPEPGKSRTSQDQAAPDPRLPEPAFPATVSTSSSRKHQVPIRPTGRVHLRDFGSRNTHGRIWVLFEHWKE